MFFDWAEHEQKHAGNGFSRVTRIVVYGNYNMESEERRGFVLPVHGGERVFIVHTFDPPEDMFLVLSLESHRIGVLSCHHLSVAHQLGRVNFLRGLGADSDAKLASALTLEPEGDIRLAVRTTTAFFMALSLLFSLVGIWQQQSAAPGEGSWSAALVPLQWTLLLASALLLHAVDAMLWRTSASRTAGAVGLAFVQLLTMTTLCALGLQADLGGDVAAARPAVLAIPPVALIGMFYAMHYCASATPHERAYADSLFTLPVTSTLRLFAVPSLAVLVPLALSLDALISAAAGKGLWLWAAVHVLVLLFLALGAVVLWLWRGRGVPFFTLLGYALETGHLLPSHPVSWRDAKPQIMPLVLAALVAAVGLLLGAARQDGLVSAPGTSLATIVLALLAIVLAGLGYVRWPAVV